MLKHITYSILFCMVTMLLVIGCDNSSIVKDTPTPIESQGETRNDALLTDKDPEIIEGE